MATFAGNVQGVVVQIATKVFSSGNIPFPSTTLNLTYIEADFFSAYSTSASAKAVSQEAHQ